ncbi:GNAT family N-acetyltransferase [Nesterenkonia muleiensis]|uniref:GNAT family N-acetyltransferase n=1 Tax=Nesterenkonia muleiensis TaxID=2282648 RepID=UPI000E7566E7|nr:GNAT family protein [Nesterenkonia muleiensis]
MRRIRILKPTDSGAITSLLRTNREYLAPWEPERTEAYFTDDAQRELIQETLKEHAAQRSTPFVILDNGDTVIGRLTLSGITHGAFQSAAMGYWLSQDCRGRGFATEAVAEAVRFAFDDLGLHRVQAETLPHNAASQRVLEKNGFREYGFAPKYLKIAGQWQDHILYQLLAE